MPCRSRALARRAMGRVRGDKRDRLLQVVRRSSRSRGAVRALDAPRGDAARLEVHAFRARVHARDSVSPLRGAGALCRARGVPAARAQRGRAWHFLDNIRRDGRHVRRRRALGRAARAQRVLAALEFCCLAVTPVIHMVAQWAAVTVAAPVSLAVAVSLGAHGLRWRRRRRLRQLAARDRAARTRRGAAGIRARSPSRSRAGPRSLVCFGRGLDDDDAGLPEAAARRGGTC